MTRETKVGLVVAASFMCLVGGVFATKYLHQNTKPDDASPVAQAPEKQPAGEEAQAAPPGDPLYKQPEAPAGDRPPLGPPPTGKEGPPINLDPPYEPKSKAPAGPLDLGPLDPPGTKSARSAQRHDDPSKDDDFVPSLPAPTTKPSLSAPNSEPQLLPVPNQPIKTSSPPFVLDAPPTTKKTPKPPSPEDMLGPPPGGVTRVANPPTPVDPIDLPVPSEKKETKPGEKETEKKDAPKLPAPGKDEAPLAQPAPSGDKPMLPPPGGEKPMGDKPFDLNPPPVPKGNKPPLDLPPDLPKTPPDATKSPVELPGAKPPVDLPGGMKPPIDLPGPPVKLPGTPPVEPRDNGSSTPPKNNNDSPAASLTRPTDAQPPEPRVESYDEEWYYCKPGDTLESISQKFFFSPKYEQALRQYNLDRNYQASFRQERPSLAAGQVVKVPPARILEKFYPSSLGLRPAPGPRSDGPTNIPSTPTQGADDLGTPREYQVRREGMTLRDIAKEELHDERQWTRIFNLNREWNPSAPIPVGTRIFLPRAQ
jgi:hypothetical protein